MEGIAPLLGYLLVAKDLDHILSVNIPEVVAFLELDLEVLFQAQDLDSHRSEIAGTPLFSLIYQEQGYLVDLVSVTIHLTLKPLRLCKELLE